LERVAGAGVESSAGTLSNSAAAALLLTPATPAIGTNKPAISTPASTLTMRNMTNEYATLPARFGLKGMANRVREGAHYIEFLRHVKKTRNIQRRWKVTNAQTCGDPSSQLGKRFVPYLVPRH
jgi:hypothetical protein